MSSDTGYSGRYALQISGDRIAGLSDAELSVLMGELLLAHAFRTGTPVESIRVNSEDKAKDDGCDGWSGKPPESDSWFGSTETCWQFKAGSAGEPARLRNEVTKRIPKETLCAGGRFVVVTSGSVSGMKGEEDRTRVLSDKARQAGVDPARIEVIGSERLATWCNEHPAIAARWAGLPPGLWRLEDWARSAEHQIPWHSSDDLKSELADRRKELSPGRGDILHLHVQGPPGVGKTRLALELCREAEWRDAVLYVRQASDVRLVELIDVTAKRPYVQLVVVADEVQAEQLRPLRDSVELGDGRVRLITVGQCESPDPARIPSIRVSPLGREEMTKVVKGISPGMPMEETDYIVWLADGYVRLARLAAETISRGGLRGARGLLGLDEIRGFLDAMLGTDDRRSLYVVAVLSRVGWFGDRQIEGESVARHLRLDWNEVRADVDRFHRRLEIVPTGGRYRRISPNPLAIHLAAEAWRTYPDLLRTLPGALPSAPARSAYYERLQSLPIDGFAREHAGAELRSFTTPLCQGSCRLPSGSLPPPSGGVPRGGPRSYRKGARVPPVFLIGGGVRTLR